MTVEIKSRKQGRQTLYSAFEGESVLAVFRYSANAKRFAQYIADAAKFQIGTEQAVKNYFSLHTYEQCQ